MYHSLDYNITNHIISENIASITTQATKKMAKVELEKKGRKKITIWLVYAFRARAEVSFLTIWEEKHA